MAAPATGDIGTLHAEWLWDFHAIPWGRPTWIRIGRAEIVDLIERWDGLEQESKGKPIRALLIKCRRVMVKCRGKVHLIRLHDLVPSHLNIHYLYFW